jgi:osmotically-inducible protein OsmY
MARYDNAWGRGGPWGYDRSYQQPVSGWGEGFGGGGSGGGAGRWRADRDFGEAGGSGSAFADGLYGPSRYGLGPYHERLKKRRRSDAELREEVEEALFYDTWVDADAIKVEVKDGVVTLRGELPNFEEIRYATDDAWDVDGVVGVRSELTVAGR